MELLEISLSNPLSTKGKRKSISKKGRVNYDAKRLLQKGSKGGSSAKSRGEIPSSKVSLIPFNEGGRRNRSSFKKEKKKKRRSFEHW